MAGPPPPPRVVPGLITTEDVMDELQRLFPSGGEAGLVIRVYGEPGGIHTEGSADAFREMLASLRMYDDGYRNDGEVFVEVPTQEAIGRALGVLAKEQHQKRLLDFILTTFGRRIIDPLAEILDTTPKGSLRGRLAGLREVFLSRVEELKMTPETLRMLSDDVRKLLNDDYLAMLAEHEEVEQRPRVKKLAQDILRLLGSIFQRALRGWPEHAARVAATITRKHQAQMRLSEVPALLRAQITGAIEEFLWVETANDIDGSLRALLAEQRSVMPIDHVPIDRDTYRDFAQACWSIIVENC